MATDTFVDAYFRQIERPKPKDRDIGSVIRWVAGNKPVIARESTFLNDWDDLVAPASSVTHTAIETLIEYCASRLHEYGFPTLTYCHVQELRSF